MWAIYSVPIIASMKETVDGTAAQTILASYGMLCMTAFMGFIFQGGPVVGHWIGKGDAAKT